MIQKIADFVYTYLLFFLPHGHPWDYIAHFIASCAIVSIIFFILNALTVNDLLAILTAVCVLLVMAIAKEISDFQAGKTDMVYDMIANFLGISAAIALILFISKPQN